VKDEIDTAGMPTMLGTQVFKDYRPSRDAFAIEKLRKAGAIILGKTTLSEYAGGDTYASCASLSACKTLDGPSPPLPYPRAVSCIPGGL
jgi:Asp-tRNA(Asn)/Glu-tRNA(Gln) amidotransferase A subunit family amidase